MTKTKFTQITIVLVLGTVLLYFTIYNLDYRIKISSFLSTPSMEFVNSNNLKKLTIKFNKKDEIHFNRLFKDFYAEGLGVENQKFIAYYSKNNNWRKTTLLINNKPYKVKIKAHGRTPYAQKFGEYFSLSIKFSENPYPFYSKRVNLIIYNRIQLRSESIKLLANKFNLPTTDFELVYAEVGNNDGSLYFVEERINKSFFEKRKLPWIIFNKGINGSLICHEDFNPTDVSKQLNLELEKRKELSPSLKMQVSQDYLSFNNSTFNGNIQELKSHLDLDYCARINAFRIINGDDGHGFSSDNFEMAYDTINRFFYPIVHRDNYGTVLNNCNNPYTFMDSTRVIIPFFILLDSDSSFIEMTNHKVKLFLKNNDFSKNIIENEIDSISRYYKKSHNFEFSTINTQTDGRWIIENADCLLNKQVLNQ